MTATKTATRPAEELPMGEPLPAELQIAPPAAPAVEQKYVVLPTDAIKPGPHNPRRDLGDLDGLVASIRAVGIQEPLLVEWATPADPYTLLAGHRRLAAAKLAGLVEVPCLVRQGASTPALRMEIALIENLQREGLSPLDEADGYRALTNLGLSQREIAQRVGCSQSNVSKKMDLLALPTALQAKVGKKKDGLTLEAAAALARLKDHPEKMAAVAKGRADLIIGAVEQAEADIAWEAKRAELVAAAKARKQTIVDEPRDQWSARKFKTLGKWGYKDRELDLDVRKHQAESCHAVMIPKFRGYYNEKPAATSVCTDPNRHTAKGASTLKVKVVAPPKREPSQHEVAQAQTKIHAKEAADARASLLAGALAEYSPKGPTSPELAMALQAGVRRTLGWDTAQVACELLRLDAAGKGSAETYGAIDRYAGEAFPLQLHRAALALAFATVEVVLSGPYARWADKGVAEHYAYLKTLGYEPSPWEKAKLAEAAERAATMRCDASGITAGAPLFFDQNRNPQPVVTPVEIP